MNRITNPELTFEQAYAQLTEVLDQLEQGELALDQSLDLYAQGRTLVKRCEELLSAADLRITQLTDDSIDED